MSEARRSTTTGYAPPPIARAATRARGSRLLLVAALALLVVLCRTWTTTPAARAALADAPALANANVVCGAPREAAATRADAAETRALAAIDRYPFDAREGLRALALFSEAADCLRLAGNEGRRSRVAARVAAWRARVEHDYRAHLMHYRLARASQRDAHALADVEFLAALWQDHDARFAAQLRAARVALIAHASDVTDSAEVR